MPDQPTGGDTSGANKDLAFLGYVTSNYHSTHFVPKLTIYADTHSNGSMSTREACELSQSALEPISLHAQYLATSLISLTCCYVSYELHAMFCLLLCTMIRDSCVCD